MKKTLILTFALTLLIGLESFAQCEKYELKDTAIAKNYIDSAKQVEDLEKTMLFFNKSLAIYKCLE